MAARTRKGTKDSPWPDITKRRTKASMLMNELCKHALGKREMSATQVRAASEYIDRVYPRMAAVEHTGDIKQTYVAQMPAPVADLAEWKAQHMDASQTLPSTDTDPTKH